MELYSWQKECLEAWQKNNYKGSVQVVTGAGKTYMALNAITLLKSQVTNPFRIKVVVPTSALARQWLKAMKETLPDLIEDNNKVGKFGDNSHDTDLDYMVYVINSARNNLAKHVIEDLKKGYDIFLICDECHHYDSQENKKIFDFLPYLDKYNKRFYSLGLSATPKLKYNDINVSNVLSNIIFNYSFTKAANDNVVSNFAIIQIALSLTADEIDMYVDYTDRLAKVRIALYKKYPELKLLTTNFFEYLQALARKEKLNDKESIALNYLYLLYKRRSICLYADNRYKCLNELIKRLDKNEKIIIFCERIQQSDKVFASLTKLFPNKVVNYHSEMPIETKRNNLKRYKDHEANILVTCKSLDEGLDVPEVTTAIVLSSTKVNRQRIQRLGRILRKSKEKKVATLYYFYLDDALEESNYLIHDEEIEYPNIYLHYLANENIFINEEYEKISLILLNNTNHQSIENIEMRKCIDEGLIKSDWLLNTEIYADKIDSSKTIHEKNYWLCMREIHLISQSLNAKKTTIIL